MSPRTPLLRPDRHFADREPTIARISVVFFVLLAAGPMVVYGVGWVLTANVDGTVLVDNPNRPPDWVCEDTPSDDSVFGQEGCDEPEQVERNVDTLLWDAINEFVGPAFVAYPLGVAVVTLLLHGGVKLVGTGRGLFRTFAVAAWGAVPSLLLIPVTLVAFSMALDPVTVAPGDDPATALEPLITNIEAVGPYTSIGAVVTAIWGGVIWRFGLVHQQHLAGAEATLVAGIVAFLTAVVGVV